MLFKWKHIINNWINCYVEKSDQDERNVTIDSLLHIISNLRENLNLDESKSSVLEAHTVEEFILEKYPNFKFKNGTAVAGCENDIYLVASLLLYFVCVNSKDVDLKSVMCSKLGEEDQEYILRFSKSLMERSVITCREVQVAITEACGLEIATMSQGSGTSVAETPPALRSLYGEVRRLHAALDAERFDRNYLQEELSRTNLRVEKLVKEKEKYKLDMMNLTAQMCVCRGAEGEAGGVGGVEGAGAEAEQVARLARQLADAECRLERTQEMLDDAVHERDNFKAKVAELKQERDKWLEAHQQESARAIQLNVELETERRELLALRELVGELWQHRQRNGLDASQLECDDVDASVQSLPHNLSVCSEACANVVEIQLGEERARVDALKQQILTLQKENEQLHFAIEEDNSNHELIIKEKDSVIDNLEKQLKKQVDLLESLRKDHEDVTLSWEKYKLETTDVIHEKEQQLTNLTEQLSLLKEDYSKLQDELNNNIQKLQKESASKLEYINKNDKLTEEISLIQEKYNKVQVELYNTVNKLQLESDSNIEYINKNEKLTEQINVCQENYNKLQDELNNTIQKLHKETDSTREYINQNEKLTEQITLLQEDYSKLQDEMKNTVLKLQKETDSKREYINENEKLLETIANDTNKYLALVQEKDTLYNQLVEETGAKDILQTEKNKECEINKALVAEKNELLNERAILAQQLAEEKSLRQIIEEQKNELSAEIAALEKTFSKQVNSIEQTLADEVAKNKTLLHDNESLKQNLAELESANHSTEKEMKNLMNEKNALEQHIIEIKNIEEELSKQIQELTEKKDTLEQQWINEKALNEMLNEEKALLLEDLTEEKATKLVLLKEKENLVTQNECLKHDLLTHKTLQECLLNDKESVILEKEELAKSLDEEKWARDEVETEKYELHFKLVKLMEKYNSEVNSKQAELDTVNQNVKMLQLKCEDLEDSNTQISNALSMGLDKLIQNLKTEVTAQDTLQELINVETEDVPVADKCDLLINIANMLTTEIVHRKNLEEALKQENKALDKLKQVLDYKDKHISKLEIEVKTLQQAVEQTKIDLAKHSEAHIKDIDNKIRDIQLLQKENQSLTNDLNDVKVQLEVKVHSLKERLIDNENVTDKLKQTYECQIDNLNLMINKLTNYLKDKSNEFEAVKKEKDKLQQVVELNNKAIRSLEEEVKTERLHREKLVNEFESERQVLKNMVTVTESVMEDQKVTLNNALSEQIKINDTLQEENKGLKELIENERNKFKQDLLDKGVALESLQKFEKEEMERKLLEQKEIMDKEINTLKSEIQEKESEVGKLKEENKKLESVIHTYKNNVDLFEKKNSELKINLDSVEVEYRSKIDKLTESLQEQIENKKNMEIELKEKTDNIVTMEVKVKHLETIINRLKQEKTDLVKERDCYLSKVDDIQVTLRTNSLKDLQQIDKLKKENTELTEKYGKLKKDYVELVEKLDKLKNNNIELIEETDLLKRTNSELVSGMAKLKINNTDLTESKNKFKCDVTHLEEKVCKLTNENVTVIEENTQLKKANAELADKYDTLQKQNTDLIEETKMLKIDVYVSEEAMAKLKIENSEITDEIATLKKHNIELADQCDNLQKEYTTLIEETNLLKTDIAVSAEAMAKLKIQNSELTEEINKLTKGNSEISDKFDILESRYVEIKKEADSLNIRNNELEADIGKLKRNESELGDKIRKLKTDNMKLQETNIELIKKNTESTEAIGKLENYKVELTEKVIQLEINNKEFSEEIDTLKKHSSELIDTMGKMKGDNSEFTEVISKLKESNTVLEESRSKLKKENFELSESINKLRNANEELVEELDKFKHHNKILTEEIDKLKIDNTRVAAELEKQKNTNSKLVEELVKFEKQNTRLIIEMGELKTDNAKLGEEISKLTKDHTSSVDQMETLKKDKMELAEGMDKLHIYNNELTQVINELKNNNNELAEIMDKLKIDNTILTEETNKLKKEKTELSERIVKLEKDNLEFINRIVEKKTAISNLELTIKETEKQLKKIREDSASEKVTLVHKCDILQDYHTKAEKELEERQKEIASFQKEVATLQAKVELCEEESKAKDGLISKMSKEKDAVISNVSKELVEERMLREKCQKELEEKMEIINELKQSLNLLNNEREALNILKKENEELIKAVGHRETFAVRSQEVTSTQKYSGPANLRDPLHQVDNTSDLTHSSIESLKTIHDLEKIIQDKNRTITTLQSDVTYLKTLMAESETKVLDVTKELEVSKENCYQLSTQLKKIVHQKNEEIAELKRHVSKMSVTENRASQIIKVSAKYQAIILKRIAEIKSNTVLKELTNFGNSNNCDNELRRSLTAGSITMEELENFLETTERHLKRCAEKQIALQKERDRLTEVNRINESEIINLKKFLTELSVSFQTFSSVKDLYAQKLSRVISVQRTVRREILSLEGEVGEACLLKLERAYAAAMQDLAECAMTLERWVERSIGRAVSPEKIKQAFMQDTERVSLAPSSVQNAGLEVQLDELESSFQKLLEEVARAPRAAGAEGGAGGAPPHPATVMEVRAEYEDKLNRMKAKMKQLYTEQIGAFKEQQRGEVAALERELARARGQLAASSAAYEQHIRGLTSELWAVGERFLLQKDEAEWLRRRQRSGSLMSLQHVHSSGLVPPQDEQSTRPADSYSLRSLPTAGCRPPSEPQAKREGRALHMSDEEGEVFDNRCLVELASTPRRESRAGSSGAPGRAPGAPSEAPGVRLSELRWRNSLCPPHLRSSYPAETQFAPSLDEDHIKALNAPGPRPQRKEVGITAYKKPGPPTPSKQAGRLSATDSELRESLRAEPEPSGAARKTSTPSRIRALFRSSKTDGNEGTPRSRRLSNIFRKK